jgi:MoaA/NifB/PqqE/SkfB family radical SAM enzyme
MAPALSGKVAFVNVGLEGPRNITKRVRGDFDRILRGVFAFREAGLPIAICAVVLRSVAAGLPFTYQIADTIGAVKIKLVHPIRKGRGARLPEEEFLSLRESEELFARLAGLRTTYGWRPALRMTTWTPETEGYSLLVYPDGTTWAWPYFGGDVAGPAQGGPPEKTLYLGNLHQMTIREIWDRYPFKVNHYRKYLGASVRTLPSAEELLPSTRVA